MNRLPLLFSFKEMVFGDGFLAEVVAKGRMLAEKEKGGVWIYGVQPGGLSAGGKDENQAYIEFKSTFIEILSHMAKKSTYEEFKEEARKFFHEVCDPTLEDWKASVIEIRKKNTNPTNFKSESAESPRSIRVKRICSVSKKATHEETVLAA